MTLLEMKLERSSVFDYGLGEARKATINNHPAG